MPEPEPEPVVDVCGPASLGLPRFLAMLAHGCAVVSGPTVAALLWLLIRPARGSFLRAHLALATWFHLATWGAGWLLLIVMIEIPYSVREQLIGRDTWDALGVVVLLGLAVGYVLVSVTATWCAVCAGHGLGARLPWRRRAAGPADARQVVKRLDIVPEPRAHAVGGFHLERAPRIEERALAAAVHVSALATAFVGPLVVHLWRGERETFVAAHAAEVLQFQLSAAVALLLATGLLPLLMLLAPAALIALEVAPTGAVMGGFATLLLLAVGLSVAVGVLWTLRAAWAAWRGRGYRYPLRWRFLDGAVPPDRS